MSDKDLEKEFKEWKKVHDWKMKSIRLCRECAFDMDSMALGRCPGTCQMCGEHKEDTNWYGIGWLIEQISGVKFDDKCIPTGKIERKADWPSPLTGSECPDECAHGGPDNCQGCMD